MNIEDIGRARTEARRFLDATEALAKSEGAVNRASGYVYPSKESGRVRRASMDLTRSLADLRRRHT